MGIVIFFFKEELFSAKSGTGLKETDIPGEEHPATFLQPKEEQAAPAPHAWPDPSLHIFHAARPQGGENAQNQNNPKVKAF